ncbi:hypothetical protein RQP46_009242 [Phenoliferia psychrophenolica]
MSRVNLGQLLAHLPHDGQGARVFQTRWAAKGLPTPTSSPASLASACFWEVKKTESKLVHDSLSTKAFGVFYWKGKRVTPAEKEYEPIKGALKYPWSTAVLPPILSPEKQPIAPVE